MTLIMACLLVTIGVFGIICLHLSARLDDANGRITLLEIKINYLERSEKTIRESIDLQTKCIRDLNDIVKRTVKNKETAEPDTKALVSGWDADEQEPIQQHISKEEWSVQLVQAILNYQRIEPLQQQCILPLQQTPSGSILPLWYINRRLEDM